MAQQQIHANHRQRMRKRFEETGFDGFSDHEVLEYILFHAIPRKDVNPIAHALMDHFGGLDRVLEASEQELTQVEGVADSPVSGGGPALPPAQDPPGAHREKPGRGG